jgi:methylenetetrahydrofolate dehydrogenase (NADP+)/methenyltetrahydrofolate cyclohydrolase
VVSGVGKQNLIRGTMIQRNAVVVDAGIAFDKNSKVVGDVHLPSVQKKARLTTPTPGGVGPITVAILLKNTVQLSLLTTKKTKEKN